MEWQEADELRDSDDDSDDETMMPPSSLKAGNSVFTLRVKYNCIYLLHVLYCLFILLII